MGQSRSSSAYKLANVRNEALGTLINKSNENTNFLAEHLKNILTNGPSSSRVQQAVSNYKENIIPQILGSLGEGKSSSALNQALATGAQNLAQGIDADSMAALQLLQNLTLGNTGAAFGANITQPKGIAQSLLELLVQGAGIYGASYIGGLAK